MAGKLIIVGTPIGNLGDFSDRAKEVLNEVDFIAAEDTRVTVKLLNHFNIKKPLISYYEHNKYQKGEQICSRILNGETCALMSDAGMPIISDPGENLVELCLKKNINVTTVPGPSALTAAIAISGISTGRFTFEGFLSVNKKSRKDHLDSLKYEERTIVFYEAPHKLYKTLCDLFEILGDRQIAIVREITKIHEENIRTTLSKACEKYKDNVLKGEIVLIVEGYKKIESDITIEEAIAYAKKLIDSGKSISESAKLASKDTKFKKSDIYKKLL